MDRRLLDDSMSEDGGGGGGGSAAFSIQRIAPSASRIPGSVVLSGSSVEMAARAIAVLNIGFGLILLMGNIMLLFLLVSYPLHEFQLIDVTILKEDPTHNVFHLANLSKKQFVFLLTLSAIYFVVEIMLANFLFVGIRKRSKSKCQLWVDIHSVVMVFHLLTLIYNGADLEDTTAYALTFILAPVVLCLVGSVWLVRKFIRDIAANQDFTSAVYYIQKE